MPKVRMLRQVTGLRDGLHWPAVGGTVELSDADSSTLVRHGHAEAVKDDPKPVMGDGLDELKLAELKDVAQERGIADYGSKAQIIARIRES